MPVLPGSLSLTVIPDGSPIIAADHRNNYGSVQTAVNGLIAILDNGNGIDGDPLVWDATLSKWSASSRLAAGRPRAPRTFISGLSGGPPASPLNNDVWIATDVNANGDGTNWVFRYAAASASAYKWEFVGGSPLRGYVGALESTTNTGAVALTTPGPTLTLLRAGEYLFEAGYYGYNTVGPASGACSADLYLNAVNTTESVFTSVSNYTHVSRRVMITVGTAGVGMTLLYRALASGTAFFGNRFLNAQPIRVA